MKQQILKIALILVFTMAILMPSKAQLIYKNNMFDHYYKPVSSVTTNYNIYTEAMWRLNGKYDMDKKKEHGIRSLNSSYYKLKKDGKRAIEKGRDVNTYDINGQLVDKQTFRRGKEKKHYIFEFNKDGQFTDYKRFNRGMSRTHEVLKYDENNNVLEYNKFKGEKFKKRWNATYKDSLIVAQWSFNKDTSEIRSKWEYKYYETNENKTTKYYSKAKLKHTWNYTCDEEGKEVKPKDETTVCELKQYNNDSTYVIIRRNTGKKGKVTKHRLTYDKKDRLILSEDFNVKDKITFKQANIYNEDGKMVAHYTYKRGKKSDQVRWGWETKLNAEGKIIERKSIWRNKVNRISTYAFEDGHQSTAIVTKGDGKLIYKIEYKYNDKGLMTDVLRFDEDGILSSKNIYDYQYY